MCARAVGISKALVGPQSHLLLLVVMLLLLFLVAAAPLWAKETPSHGGFPGVPPPASDPGALPAPEAELPPAPVPPAVPAQDEEQPSSPTEMPVPTELPSPTSPVETPPAPPEAELPPAPPAATIPGVSFSPIHPTHGGYPAVPAWGPSDLGYPEHMAAKRDAAAKRDE